MKTALVLAGGGSRGAYEMGVWQALREMGIKIDIVTGTSIGSMNATLVANDSFEEARDLWLSLKTEDVFDYKHAVENKGVRFTSVKDIMASVISEEKVRNSGIDLGIVTTKVPDFVSVHNWKEDIPEGELLDYVFASCSCFPVVMPYEIDGEKYIDGGTFDTMPVGMALEKDPDQIIAVFLNGIGGYQKADVERAGDKLRLIECHWDMGSFTKFDPSHAAELIRLGYLDTMKSFGAFTGKKYTFLRGHFSRKDLDAIETAAEMLDMDPLLIYSRPVFIDTAKAVIARQIDEVRKAGKEIKAFDLRKLDLKKIDMTKFNPEEFKALNKDKFSDNFDASQIEIIAIGKFMAKNPMFKPPRTFSKKLRDKIAAAQWLISEGVIWK